MGPFVGTKILLNNIFYGFEAEQIIQLPLINPNKEDKLMWMATRFGNYTVK
jgi:hypothetical protein